jgi:hypothetical protein
MPDHPRRDRSPADDGLYLVPYWVQGGRTWLVILAALLGGERFCCLQLPGSGVVDSQAVLATVRRQQSARWSGTTRSWPPRRLPPNFRH